MKKLLLSLSLIQCLLTSFMYGQKTPILHQVEAYVVNFENIGTKPIIRINIADDFRGIYSVQDMSDSTLVFKDQKEEKQYRNLIKERDKAIEKLQKLKEKYEELKAAGKTDDLPKIQKQIDELKIPIIDTKPYITNRSFLKPGMQIDLDFDEYNFKRLLIVKRIIVTSDFDREQKIDDGILETTGDIAKVDGRLVKLNPNVVIEGAEAQPKEYGSFKGKKFKSFGELDAGMLMDLDGQNQNDGILYVKKGVVRPHPFTKTDAKVIENLKNSMQLTPNTVSMGTLKFQLVPNAKMQDYVNKVGNSLIPTFMKEMTKDQDGYINFKFYVVQNDSTFNACSYPDGSTFIYTGLLKAIDNPSQLAAVLGHEISHVVYHHGRKTVDAKGSSDIVKESLSIANDFGLPKNEAVELTLAFGGPFLVSLFSKNFENQADRNGLMYMANAGFDPREAPKIWLKVYQKAKTEEKLSIRDKFQAFMKQTMYGSHPLALTRYKNLNLLLAQNFQDKDYREEQSKFDTQIKEYQEIKKLLDIKEPIKTVPAKK
jgi:hypothetical protein